MHYHIIGICGSGMSAIAHILKDQGHVVSGCDVNTDSAAHDDLLSHQIGVLHGHDPSHINLADRVICSDIKLPEIDYAISSGKTVKRYDLYREWSNAKPMIGVSGTSGKTTTTAMIAHILRDNGVDASYLIPAGGPAYNFDVPSKWAGDPLVIEIDESDRDFNKVQPEVLIILNVLWDHRAPHKTREEEINAFRQLTANAKQVIICSDDDGARVVTDNVDSNMLTTYGTYGDWSIHGDVVVFDGKEYAIDASYPGGGYNAVAAMVACGFYGVSPEKAVKSLSTYRGVYRRFRVLGERNGVVVIDDFAHNPSKIRAAIIAARMKYKDRRIVVYCRPIAPNRVRKQMQDLADSLGLADVCFVGGLSSTINLVAADDSLERQLAEIAGATYVGHDMSKVEFTKGDVVVMMGPHSMERESYEFYNSL